MVPLNMPETNPFERRLRIFSDHGRDIVAGMRRGIEKESLRITADGHLSQKDHPAALGSALTHPSITTDYSEALIELVTPTFASPQDALEHLDELHRIVYHHIPDELLWVNSLPCLLGDESSIRIATFGTSNIGKMKHAYRRGLELRYGRKMQTIAGIHYNISMPSDFWMRLGEDPAAGRADAASSGYMAGIRNFHRYCWLLFYLFGASPAACRSFFDGKDAPGLAALGTHTQYGRYATSLRMSNIGYRNPVQSEIRIDHNSVAGYIETLRKNTITPYPAYVEMGVKVDGEYIQLNPNLLQIENEYYSVVRPKRSIRPLEHPSKALDERGVEYLEIRCVDLDPNTPRGLSLTQAQFLEMFAVYCMLCPSPPITDAELSAIADNKDKVVLEGRRPGQTLLRGNERISLADWGRELLSDLRCVAEVFDDVRGNGHRQVIKSQLEKIDEPDCTPSAQILDELKREGTPFFTYAMSKAFEAKSRFTSRRLSEDTLNRYQALASESIQQQRQMEASDALDFDSFLENYFAQ